MLCVSLCVFRGNYEDERPYIEGDWCSRCPENLQKCENNLCGTTLSLPECSQDDCVALLTLLLTVKKIQTI